MSKSWRACAFLAPALTAIVLAAVAARAQQDVRGAYTFRRDIAEVHLWFTAEDRAGVPVAGLAVSQLTVFDGGERVQRPFRLSEVDDAPVRVHFVVDVSGSDQHALAMIQAALAQFVGANSLPGDAVRVTAFSDRAVSSRFFSPGNAAAFWSAAAELIGRPVTAIYDNLYPALTARQDYDAVVLISDGMDNWSAQHSLLDILAAAAHSPARMFVLGIKEKRHSLSRDTLDQIAQASGGQVMGVRTVADFERALSAIAQSLRTYYSVSFPIAEKQRDGRFHSVTLRTSDGRIARIHGKPGYYAPPRKASVVESAIALAP